MDYKSYMENYITNHNRKIGQISKDFIEGPLEEYKKKSFDKKVLDMTPDEVLKYYDAKKGVRKE